MEAIARVAFGLFGLAVLIGLAWLFSNNKKAVDWKLVITGLSLQIAFAALVLLVPGGKDVTLTGLEGVAAVLPTGAARSRCTMQLTAGRVRLHGIRTRRRQ